MFDPVFHAKKKGITIEEAKAIIASWRPSNIEYWLKHTGGDLCKSKELLDTHQKKGMNTRLKDRKSLRESNIRCKEYWQSRFGLTEDEAANEISKIQNNSSLEKFITRYGADAGVQKWKAQQDNWQKTLKSKSKEELDKINRLKATDHRSLWETIGTDEYLTRLKKQTKRPAYELYNYDDSVRCFIIKKMEPEFKKMLQELTLDMAAVARLCSLLEASQVFGKYKNYIPYEPILRFCGIKKKPIKRNP